MQELKFFHFIFHFHYLPSESINASRVRKITWASAFPGLVLILPCCLSLTFCPAHSFFLKHFFFCWFNPVYPKSFTPSRPFFPVSPPINASAVLPYAISPPNPPQSTHTPPSHFTPHCSCHPAGTPNESPAGSAWLLLDLLADQWKKWRPP